MRFRTVLKASSNDIQGMSFPVKSKEHSKLILNAETKFIISKYSNMTMIVITQMNKMGQFVSFILLLEGLDKTSSLC